MSYKRKLDGSVVMNHPLFIYLDKLDETKKEHIMEHFGEIESFMSSYEIELPIKNESSSPSAEDVLEKYKYLVDAFKIVCPLITIYVNLNVGDDSGFYIDPSLLDVHSEYYYKNLSKIDDAGNSIWYSLKLEWKEGEMDKIVYNKSIFPERQFLVKYKRMGM